jgi:hypothetical protein
MGSETVTAAPGQVMDVKLPVQAAARPGRASDEIRVSAAYAEEAGNLVQF